MPNIVETSPGVFIEQPQQGPSIELPNGSVSLSQLSPGVQAQITDSTLSLAGGSDINWALNKTFFDVISSAKSYTFSGVLEGKTIILQLTNSTAGALALSWPVAVKWPGGTPVSTIPANGSIVFTFIQVNSTIFAASTAY